MTASIGPPRVARLLVRCTAPARDRDVMLGDLDEEFDRLAATDLRAASRWYRDQALSSLPQNLARATSRRPRTSAASPQISLPLSGTGDPVMTSFRHELVLAMRSLARRRRFTATVVMTLAVAIAAVTATFSVVDAVVLSPFPFPENDSLVTIGTAFPKTNSDLSFFENLSPAEYLDIAAGVPSLQGVVAWDMGNRQVTVGDETRNAFSALWWGDAMPTLRVPMALGRGFSADEIRTGAPVAVVSARLFRDRLGSDASRLGQPLLVGGEPYTLIGVLPRRVLIYGTDLWIPMGASPDAFPRGRRQFQVLARIASGATLERTNLELDSLARRLDTDYRAAHPEYERFRLEARSFIDVNVALLRPGSVVLVGAGLLFLLVASANVTSLLVARAVERGREIATRLALGAGRRQIFRQLGAEAIVLTTLGCVLGIFLAERAVAATRVALGRFPLPVPGDVSLSGVALALSILVSTAVAAFFALAPAAWVLRGERAGLLRSASPSAFPGRLGTQRALLAAQMAFAGLLVTAGALGVRSLLELQAVDPGYAADRIFAFRTTLPESRYRDDAAFRNFFERATLELRAMPGVEEVALASETPPSYFSSIQFTVEGEEAASEGALRRAYFTTVSPSYFSVMGLRVVEGRALTRGDHEASESKPLVIAINTVAAERFFKGRSPMGERLRVGAGEQARVAEIVGVVSSIRQRGLDSAPGPEIFMTFGQAGWSNQLMTLARTTGDPRTLLPAARAAVFRVDAQQTVYLAQSLRQAIENHSLPRSFATLAILVLAGFALALAGGGVYAVASYVAAMRFRELGVRMALGANAAMVRRFVARQALIPVALGGIVGLAAGVLGARGLGSMLFGVPALDPPGLSLAAAVLLAVALVAADGPAKRASRSNLARILATD